ncbi:hypothetical protein D8B26_002312 [Coccidioides posadasii str. Silveira]|uniref:uncharacterized protein n=1 Tax=Coccidioides posadasii (strain RMSCC 757 / Silveira) TaxID=443226 RepID=UPI001BEE88F5|nr:hypothetical protein D8B26_002312 [Coccidioides posadasii str. Silveira]
MKSPNRDIPRLSSLEAVTIDLKPCPSIFVLPTHLTLEELHGVEETLTACGALVTYDIREAGLVLGKLSQKKRAALELRARGLWTEEISHPAETPCTPPVKRRRLNSPAGTVSPVKEPQTIDLDSVSEFEGSDRLDSPKKSHKKVLKPPATPAALAPASIDPPLSPPHDNDIRVLRLEWLRESLAARHSLPMKPYTVYYASKQPRPDTTSYTTSPLGLGLECDTVHSTPQTPSRKRDGDSLGILERARADAATVPRPLLVPSVKSQRARLNHGSRPSQKLRPKLYRKSTSEHEGATPLPPAPDWVRDNVLYACLRSAPLHPPNEGFINQLLKIKRIRELTLDEIGVRAYSTSIAAIAAYPYPLQTPEEVLTIPGCETRIANWFAEWKQSPDGILEAANQLDTDPVYSTLNMFYNIWGVGAKSARDFYYHRNWRDLDDVVEHGWDSLSRVQQIGVKYYDEFMEGITRAEVESISHVVLEHARRARPDSDYDGKGIECIIVGGYRRGKERSGDVDIILSHRDEGVTHNLVYDVVSSLEEDGWITHTLALHLTNTQRDQQPLPYRGETARGKHHFDTLDKALVVWQDPHFDSSAASESISEEHETIAQPSSDEQDDKIDLSDKSTSETPSQEPAITRKRNPNLHRRVDIIISPWRSVGCAVLGWSGDTTFERDLRRYAKKAYNWKFDSSGIRAREGSGGRVIDLESKGETWEERERLVMEGLGVGWRPPEERCTR